MGLICISCKGTKKIPYMQIYMGNSFKNVNFATKIGDYSVLICNFGGFADLIESLEKRVQIGLTRVIGECDSFCL